MKDMNSFVERNQRRMDYYCQNVMDIPHEGGGGGGGKGEKGGEDYEKMFEGEERELVRELEVIVSCVRPHVEKVGKALHVL